MKIIIIIVSLLLSACSSSPRTPETRVEAIQHHKTLADQARKRGHAIAVAPAASNSHEEMNRAYNEAKRHTLRAAALQEGDSFIVPFLARFVNFFK